MTPSIAICPEAIKVLKRFRFRLLTIFVLMTVAAAAFAIWPSLKLRWHISQLSNDDLSFNGTPWGLIVSLEGDHVEAIRSYGTDANRVLCSQIERPEKFAAAHRLLWEINQRRFLQAGGYWDRGWDPYANWSNDFDTSLIPALREFWQKALAEPMAFSEFDRIFRFEYYDSLAYGVGDLVHCEAEDEEFRLEITGTIYEMVEGDHASIEHPFSQSYSFRRITEDVLLDGFTPRITEQKTVNHADHKATVRTEFTACHPSWVKVKIDWDLSAGDLSKNIKGEFFAQLEEASATAKSEFLEIPPAAISGLNYSFSAVQQASSK